MEVEVVASISRMAHGWEICDVRACPALPPKMLIASPIKIEISGGVLFHFPMNVERSKPDAKHTDPVRPNH